MKNDELAKLHYFLNWITKGIESYCDEYKDIMPPYDFMKSTWRKYQYDRIADLFGEFETLRSEKRAIRRNMYAVLGSKLFKLDEKNLGFFTNIMILRADLLKCTDITDSDYLFYDENQKDMINHYHNSSLNRNNEDKKMSFLVEGIQTPLTEEEDDFMAEMYVDASDQMLEIDQKLNNKFKLSSFTNKFEFSKDELEFNIPDVMDFIERKNGKA